jgi:hypothetical protein
MDLYKTVVGWFQDREIDTGYLRHGPRLSFWRVADTVQRRWFTVNNYEWDVPVFLCPSGHTAASVGFFTATAYGFCHELLSAMRLRVDDIRQHGWRPADCRVDIDELVSEQTRREAAFSRMRNHVLSANWDHVRVHLNMLRGIVGQ